MKRFACLVGLCAVVASCSRGPVEYHLSGSVTFKGQPVPAGNIVFEPNVAKGNSGSPGRAKIRDGKYDTRLEDSHGTIGGPHIVRVIGIDGKKSGDERGEILMGTPLFPEYSVEIDLPKQDGTKDIEVPAQ